MAIKIRTKLASSNTIEASGIKSLIAEYYYTQPSRVTLIDKGDHWAVQSGEKILSTVVVKVGRRYVFGYLESRSP